MSDQQQQQQQQGQGSQQFKNDYVDKAVEAAEQKVLGHALSQNQTQEISNGIEAEFKSVAGSSLPGV